MVYGIDLPIVIWLVAVFFGTRTISRGPLLIKHKRTGQAYNDWNVLDMLI
jgi:hypothetical protein